MVPILLVDDDGDILDLVQLLAEERGHEVITAPNGAVALTLARQHTPRLILTDLMMPFLDGYELIAAIRADPVLWATPIVVMTAGGVTGAQRRALASIQQLITKPFRIEEVEAVFDTIGRDG